QLDARRVSAARPAFRDRVPRPDGGMADGWETADRAPVYRLQKLPPPDTGRPALIHLGLPQNLRPPGGARALIRYGPGQSQSVDSRPFARTAGGAARPRRCPRPLPRGPRPAPRGLRGRRGDRGRPAGGGAHPCGSHPSRRAGLLCEFARKKEHPSPERLSPPYVLSVLARSSLRTPYPNRKLLG